MYGTIWEYDGQAFIYYLNALESKYAEIIIRLHTYGGDVFAGNLICNAIERSNSKIKIIVDGLAASMGAVIILSATDVEIVNNGYVMIHAPHSGSYGNAKDHESSAKLLRLMEDNFIDKLMMRTGKTREEVALWLTADTWLGAQEAQDLGIVASVIPASVSTVYPAFDPDDVGEAEVYNMYGALLTNLPTPAASILDKPQLPQSNFNDNMKQLLITAFALQGLNAQSSDTAVLDALQKKFSDTEAAGNLEKIGKEAAEAKLKQYEDGRVKSLIDGAEAALGKKFSDDEKKTYETIGATSGVEALELVFKTVVPAKPAAPNIGAVIQNGSGKGAAAAGRENWDFAQWQKEDPKGLEKMAAEDTEKFQALFNAKYQK